MILRTFVTLAAIVSVSPAAALSCLRPDAVTLYEQARDSEDAYYIVRGELQITGPVDEPDPETGEPGRTEARLLGTMLSGSGFAAPFDRPVTIVSTCAGPWCADPTGQKGLLITAIRIDEDGLTLEADPCSSNMVPFDHENAERLLACHRKDECLTDSDF